MLVESPSFLGASQTFRLADADIKTVDLAGRRAGYGYARGED